MTCTQFITQVVSLLESKMNRSSPLDVSLGKDVLKICSKFTGEHPCRSEISIKLQRNFIEITLPYGCFPVNLLHISRTPFYKNTSGGLLLNEAINPFQPSVVFHIETSNRLLKQIIKNSQTTDCYFYQFNVIAIIARISIAIIIAFIETNISNLGRQRTRRATRIKWKKRTKCKYFKNFFLRETIMKKNYYIKKFR